MRPTLSYTAESTKPAVLDQGLNLWAVGSPHWLSFVGNQEMFCLFVNYVKKFPKFQIGCLSVIA
jgi:hypothetical protein